jgi:hypothetical protein
MSKDDKVLQVLKVEIKDGSLIYTYENGTTFNLGKVVGDDGVSPKPEDCKGDRGEPGISVRFTRDKDNLIALYSNGEQQDLGNFKGKDAAEIDVPKLVEEVLSKVVVPEPVVVPAPTVEEVSKAIVNQVVEKIWSDIKIPEPIVVPAPTAEEVAEVLLPKITIPEPVVPTAEEVAGLIFKKVVDNDLLPKKGDAGEPGKDAPFSSTIKVEDFEVYTNKNNPGKKVTSIPVNRLISAQINALACDNKGINFYTAIKAYSFLKNEKGQIVKIKDENVIAADRSSSPEFSVTMNSGVGGVELHINGSKEEEMTWKLILSYTEM